MKSNTIRIGVLLCAVLIAFVSLVPSASAAGYGTSLRSAYSLNNGDWIWCTNPGEDFGVWFDYNGVSGTIPFDVRFTVPLNSNYDYIEWTIYTEVVTIDSISAYSSYFESALPFEINYINGQPSTDHNGDTGYPMRRIITVRVDCSKLYWGGGETPYLRINGTWLSDGREGQNVTIWGCDGLMAGDVITPETTWLEKILNGITSGFSNVGNWITSQTSSIGNWFSTTWTNMANGFSSVTSLLGDILDALTGGSAGDDLVEGGDQIADAGSGLQDDIGQIQDFENEHFGTLDSNMGTIVSGGGLGGIAASLYFVQHYTNLIVAGIPSNYLVIFTLPILFGIFMYIVGHPIKAPRPDTSGDQVTRETFTTTTVLQGKNVGATTVTRTVTKSQEIGRVHNE